MHEPPSPQPREPWRTAADLLADDKDRIDRERETLLNQVRDLREQLGASKADCTERQEQLKEAHAKISALEQHASSLAAAMEEKDRAYASVKDVLDARDREIADFHLELNAVRAILAARDEEIRNLKTALEQSRNDKPRS